MKKGQAVRTMVLIGVGVVVALVLIFGGAGKIGEWLSSLGDCGTVFNHPDGECLDRSQAAEGTIYGTRGCDDGKVCAERKPGAGGSAVESQGTDPDSSVILTKIGGGRIDTEVSIPVGTTSNFEIAVVSDDAKGCVAYVYDAGRGEWLERDPKRQDDAQGWYRWVFPCAEGGSAFKITDYTPNEIDFEKAAQNELEFQVIVYPKDVRGESTAYTANTENWLTSVNLPVRVTREDVICNPDDPRCLDDKCRRYDNNEFRCYRDGDNCVYLENDVCRFQDYCPLINDPDTCEEEGCIPLYTPPSGIYSGCLPPEYCDPDDPMSCMVKFCAEANGEPYVCRDEQHEGCVYLEGSGSCVNEGYCTMIGVPGECGGMEGCVWTESNGCIHSTQGCSYIEDVEECTARRFCEPVMDGTTYTGCQDA